MRFYDRVSNTKRPKGQGLVEFALILPILLFLVFGIIEVGRLLFVYVAVTSSSREAARFGAAVGALPSGQRRYADCTAIRNAASGLGTLIGLQPSDIVVQYDSGLANLVATPTPFATCAVGGVGPSDVELGDRITVRVSKAYSPLLGIIPIPSFPIDSVSSRTILEAVPVGTASILPTITVTPSPVLPKMWVENITITVVPVSGNRYEAHANITVRGGSTSGPVTNASVTGAFSGDTSSSDTKVVDGSGVATLISSRKNDTWSGWTVCVTVMTSPTHIYDASLNKITCKGIANALPTLKLVKTVINDNGGTLIDTNFPAFINGNAVAWGVAQTLAAGTYTVSETSQNGYTASVWGGDCAANGTITLVIGDVKTCTITNDDVAPTLTLVKKVINDEGGTLTTADFPAFINGSPVAWGVAQTLTAGTYKVSETGTSSYAASAWGGDCAADGTVTLGVGEKKICEITNDDIPPTPTETFTPGPSPTPTDIPTITPTPTVTETPSPSPTFTATSTFTPSPTPTPVCNYNKGATFTYTANNLFWSLTNNNGGLRTITAISFVNWPGVPTSQKLQRIFFGGTLIWSGNSTSPPTVVNSGWSGVEADRQMAVGATKTLQFDFFNNLQAGLYVLDVTFDDGCVVSISQAITP